MGNLVPSSALPVLNRTLDAIRMRANADGEVFGGEIMEVMRDAGSTLGVDRLELLLIRTVLVRAMESLGENYPTEVLQNHENRMRVSDAIKYLREAIDWTSRQQNAAEGAA
jgi:hypothetical protein